MIDRKTALIIGGSQLKQLVRQHPKSKRYGFAIRRMELGRPGPILVQTDARFDTENEARKTMKKLIRDCRRAYRRLNDANSQA